MTKALLTLSIVVALVVLSGTAAYAWLARDRGPSHPVLAASALPPLIPLRAFWANTDSEWEHTLSPDGAYLSWYAVKSARTVIHVRHRATGREFVIRPHEGQNARYWWEPDARHLRLVQFKDNRTAIWRIDAQQPDASWTEVTPRGFQSWYVARRPVTDADPYYFTTHDRSGQFTDVYRVDADGLRRELAFQNPGDVQAWVIGLHQPVLARIRNTAPGAFAFERAMPDDSWEAVLDYHSTDVLRPLSDDGGTQLYALSNRGREHVALVRIDLRTGVETVMAGDPERSVEEVLMLDPDAPRPDVVRLGGGAPRYVAQSELGRNLLETLADLRAPFAMRILSRTHGGRQLTVEIDEREDGFRTAFIDTGAKTLEWISEHPMRRFAGTLADTEARVIEARDGLQVPILLTRVPGAAGATPMVALIHGGPGRHDRWGYTRFVQFLANRGYAVLRVNYRGSTGFGRAFQRAGDHQYGRAMQDDIADAVQWAITQGIADPGRIAIMGASFGGYSAVMGLARDPKLYAAGISIAGASDLEYQTVNAPHFWGPDKTYWTRVIGDPANDDDRAQMREHSPINRVDNIAVPVLLAHGIVDRVVDRSDCERLERRLRELGKPVEAYYFEKEGHAFQRWQTNVRLGRRLEEFLARTLGGRSGGFDYVEIGAEYLYP
ncbi:MAG: prolyl oligopeptidase family serine peptidase [Burkholderiaceae bacterium]